MVCKLLVVGVQSDGAVAENSSSWSGLVEGMVSVILPAWWNSAALSSDLKQ